MAHPPLDVVHTATVTDDQIDALGHMNVRWYTHLATLATSAMVRRLGIDAPELLSAYTRHHREQLLGDRLEVRSGVLADPRRLRMYHELRNADDGGLAATFVHELDHGAVEAPPVTLPDHGRPRSIDLGADRVANAPTLGEAIGAGLAVRLPRAVDDDDTAGAATVPHRNAAGLVWVGETADEADGWIQSGPDGQRIAWATMESRIWAPSLPTSGARIQSFGAPIRIGEKFVQQLYWVFALDTADLLVVMEVVSIVLDLDARRAIPIPSDLRALRERQLRPDLAEG